MFIKNKKRLSLGMSAIALSISPIIPAISCSIYQVQLKDIDYNKNYVARSDDTNYDIDSASVLETYLPKYKQLRNINNYLVRSNPKTESDIAIIYLHGGPTFTKVEQLNQYWYLGVSNSNRLPYPVRGDYFTFNQDDFEVYSFIESQAFMMNKVGNINYSYEFANDVNKVTLSLLDESIKHLKEKGKKVYVMGHSFGGFLLYSYLSAFKNTVADGIVVGAGRLEMDEYEEKYLTRKDMRLGDLLNFKDYFDIVDQYYKLTVNPQLDSYFTNKILKDIDWEGLNENDISYPSNGETFTLDDLMLNDFIYKYDKIMDIFNESIKLIMTNFKYFNKVGGDYLNSYSAMKKKNFHMGLVGESIDLIYDVMYSGHKVSSPLFLQQLIYLSNLLKLQYSTMKISNINKLTSKNHNRRVVAVAAMNDEATATLTPREIQAHKDANIPLITMDVASHNLWYFNMGDDGNYIDPYNYFSGMAIGMQTLLNLSYDYPKIFGSDLRLEMNNQLEFDGRGNMLGTGETPFIDDVGYRYLDREIYGYTWKQLALYKNALEI